MQSFRKMLGRIIGYCKCSLEGRSHTQILLRKRPQRKNKPAIYRILVAVGMSHLLRHVWKGEGNSTIERLHVVSFWMFHDAIIWWMLIEILIKAYRLLTCAAGVSWWVFPYVSNFKWSIPSRRISTTCPDCTSQTTLLFSTTLDLATWDVCDLCHASPDAIGLNPIAVGSNQFQQNAIVLFSADS